MPLAQECLITVDVANALRSLADAMGIAVPGGDLRFRCKHCGESVRPHKASAPQAAHFEHLQRNPACPLSDRLPFKLERQAAGEL
ncbi:MAG: hypothetical protein ABIS06_20645 [Vicinamibacterales bacterium]